MGFKKTVKKEENKEITNKKVIIPNLVKVMDKKTKKIIIIDSNKEKDFKSKYLHCGGSAFIN